MNKLKKYDILCYSCLFIDFIKIILPWS